MTSKWSTIPTAVITESSEKMASSTTICVTTPQNFAPLRCVGLLLSFPSSRSVQLHRGFEQQEETTKQHD